MQPSLAIICENINITPDPTVMALRQGIHDKHLHSTVVSLPYLQQNRTSLKSFEGVIFNACCTENSDFNILNSAGYDQPGQRFSGLMKNQLATAFSYTRLNPGNMHQLLELSLFCTRNDMIWLGEEMAASEFDLSKAEAEYPTAHAYAFGQRIADIVIKWHHTGY